MDKQQEEQSNRSLHEQIDFLELQVKFLCYSLDEATKQTLWALNHADKLLKSDTERDTIKVFLHALMDDLRDSIARPVSDMAAGGLMCREWMEQVLSAAQEEYAERTDRICSPFYLEEKWAKKAEIPEIPW